MIRFSWPLLLAIAINLTFSTLGDAFSKLWGVTENNKWFYIALPINIVTMVAFILIVRYAGLAIPTAIVLILTILLNVLTGFVIFKENITPTQWLGIILAIVAIPLLLGVFSYKRQNSSSTISSSVNHE